MHCVILHYIALQYIYKYATVTPQVGLGPSVVTTGMSRKLLSQLNIPYLLHGLRAKVPQGVKGGLQTGDSWI